MAPKILAEMAREAFVSRIAGRLRNIQVHGARRLALILKTKNRGNPSCGTGYFTRRLPFRDCSFNMVVNITSPCIIREEKQALRETGFFLTGEKIRLIIQAFI